MDSYLTQFQSANSSDQESIENFIVRKNEFEKVISDIRTTKPDSSLKHYVFVGWRGSGKSTLLRRIQAEINTDKSLNEKYVAVNLGEEQSGVYRLFDLWDYIIRDLNEIGFKIEKVNFKDFSHNLKEYTSTLHSQIISALREQGKGLVLLVDNIDRIFESLKEETSLFRELLINFLDIRIIGGSTVMSEQFWKYDMPFYQFFTVKNLDPLTLNEIELLLKHWSDVRRLPEIAKIINKHPGKIQSIRMLTDGTPRTMSIFVDMIINRPVQNGYEYLKVIVDKATPIYQERLGTLSPAQRKVITELSFFWEATTIDKLVDNCNMESKTVSALLNQLYKAEYVEKIKGDTKNLMYRLKERFFNLWLIMTQGGPQQRREAKYLTNFLQTWYDEPQLSDLCQELLEIGRNPDTKIDYLHSMSRALLNSKKISSKKRVDFYLDLRNKLRINEADIGRVENYFENFDEEIERAFDDRNLPKAIELLEASSLEQGRKFFELALAYTGLGQLEQAKGYYRQAISQGVVEALNNLANLYKEEGKTDLAIDFYNQAISKGQVMALFNLANLYKEEGQLDLAIDYYKQAIVKGSVEALFNLANIYREKEETDLAIDYYKQAINKGQDEALFNLGVLYMEKSEIDLAIECFKKAIDKGHEDALFNLGILYSEKGETDLAVEYYQKSVEKGKIEALNNLGVLYMEKGELDLAKTQYEKAIDEGHEDALINLGLLYVEKDETDLAIDSFKKALDEGHTKAFLNLLILYYANNNKKGIRDLLEKQKELINSINIEFYLILNLYLGNMNEFNELLKVFKKDRGESSEAFYTIVHLLIHKQYNLTLDYLKTNELGKERYKPLYYTTLRLMDNVGVELLKMPPELEESVNDIVLGIRERQEFYYG